MKIYILLPLLFILFACSKPSDKNSEDISIQAKTYSLQYHNHPKGFPPVLLKYESGELQETLYFDLKRKKVGYELFDKGSPYNQFLIILKENSQLSYSEASKSIESSFNNYFAKDCPKIDELLSKIKSLDVSYQQKTYSLNLDSPSYQYFYLAPDTPISYVITTGIEEHPIANLYNETHETIENCSHPIAI